MARFAVEPPPFMVDVLAGNRFTSQWERFWQTLIDSLSSRPQVCAIERHTGLSGTTVEAQVVTRESLPAGLYRITFTRTPATVGGSVAVTIAWTSGAVRQSTSTSTASGSVLMDVDAGTTIGWAVAHVAPPASVDVALVLERVQ